MLARTDPEAPAERVQRTARAGLGSLCTVRSAQQTFTGHAKELGGPPALRRAHCSAARSANTRLLSFLACCVFQAALFAPVLLGATPPPVQAASAPASTAVVAPAARKGLIEQIDPTKATVTQTVQAFLTTDEGIWIIRIACLIGFIYVITRKPDPAPKKDGKVRCKAKHGTLTAQLPHANELNQTYTTHSSAVIKLALCARTFPRRPTRTAL